MVNADAVPPALEFEELQELFSTKVFQSRDEGWHPCPNASVNDGALGNRLEDLLGIKENNLQIPDLGGVFELKTQRAASTANVSLFHLDPEPRHCPKCGKRRSLVQKVLLDRYGWPHDKAGTGPKYPEGELSLRVTMSPGCDRGFRLERVDDQIRVCFDAEAVCKSKHSDWLAGIEERHGLGEVSPQPFWSVRDIQQKFEQKLSNLIFVLCETRGKKDEQEVRFLHAKLLREVSSERFLDLLFAESSAVIEFDTRTGHNHGTKFRIARRDIPELFGEVHDIGKSPFT